MRGPRTDADSSDMGALVPSPPDSWGLGLWVALLLPILVLSPAPPALPVPAQRQSLVTSPYLAPYNAKV
jgi:hypothetical protein